MQPSRGCIVKKTEGGASSAEGGTGADAWPSASRTAGRPSAPPGRGQAAKAVFRRRRMARIRRMRGAHQAGRAARRQARTPPERPNAPAPTARDSAPGDAPQKAKLSEGSRADCAAIERTSEAKWPQGAAPTHRSGKGRSAKRTRPKPIWRLASAADASETALSARSERLGRNHAQVREERKRWTDAAIPVFPMPYFLQTL